MLRISTGDAVAAMFDQPFQDQLPKKAIEFFVVFSRFERAMKRAGAYARGNEKEVKADWVALATDLGDGFFDMVKASNIAPTLMEKSPKKQIKSADGTLGWRDMGEVKTTLDLFLAVRRARNNLMHGGKYMDVGGGQHGVVEGSERDDVLLSESLQVLRLAYERNDAIRQHFDN